MFRTTILLIGWMVWGSCVHARDPERQPLEFALSQSGDIPYTMLEIDGSRNWFLIDTGASVSAIDASYRDGVKELQGSFSVEMPVGRTKMTFYDAGDLDIGRGTLISKSRWGSVMVVDLRSLSETVGRDLRGVIGMDVLRNFCLSLDFSKGVGQIKERAEDQVDLGQSTVVAMEFFKRVPKIGVPESELEFLFDTGSNSSMAVPAPMFAQLQELKWFKNLSHTVRVGGDGKRRKLPAGELKDLEMFGRTVQSLAVSQIENSPYLGMGFWRHFRVEADFPNQKLALSPIDEVPAPRPRADQFFGVGKIHFPDGIATLDEVSDSGLLAKAGLKDGDQILKVDDLNIGYGGLDFFAFFDHCLSNQGNRVTLSLSREGKEQFAVMKIPPGSSD